ncbi:MAG: IPTL-CTERM sorting domain-containing protein [Candidatus Krumholzibacteriia bacterium]
MKKAIGLLAAFVLGITAIPALACFTHSTGEPDTWVIPMTATQGEIRMVGFRTRFIGPTAQCAIALKFLPSIQSVDSARAEIEGHPGNFNFSMSTACSSDFTTLFGSPAQAFIATTSSQIDSLRPVTLRFFITLAGGSTFNDLVSQLDLGVLRTSSKGPAGGSPVAGSKGGGSGALASARSAAVCLPGTPSQLFPTAFVSLAGPSSIIPALSEWGMITAAVLMLAAGIWAMRRRTGRSPAS